MKRIVLFVLLALLGCNMAEAQHRSIRFEETKDWQEIVKKARKARKLIFVDCCTSWCGPCKMLAKNVFTDDEVADFCNANFINAKFDMQKDKDGVMIKGKYKVNGYPTLLFIDPRKETVVHRMLGNRGVQIFLEGARVAADKERNLTGLIRRYEAGERDMEFMKTYVHSLAMAGMKTRLAPILPDYMSRLTDKEFFTDGNWRLFERNVEDPISFPARKFMAGRPGLDSIIPRKEVEAKLQRSLDKYISTCERWDPAKNGEFDEARNREVIAYLKTLQMDRVPSFLARLYTSVWTRQGEYRKMFGQMQEALSYNFFNDKDLRNYINVNLSKLGNCKDKALLKEALEWLDNISESREDCLYRSTMLDVKIILQTGLDDKEGLSKTRQEKARNQAEVEAYLMKKYNIKKLR